MTKKMIKNLTTEKLIDQWIDLNYANHLMGILSTKDLKEIARLEKEIVKREVDLDNLKSYAGSVQRVKIKKHLSRSEYFRYEADPADQPGSPRIGVGPTPFLALKDLLMNNKKFNIHVMDETGELS